MRYFLELTLGGTFQCYSKGRTSIKDGIKVIHTELYPTKSAVTGMIAAAYGIPREETEEIKKISDGITMYCVTKGHENPIINLDYQKQNGVYCYREYLTMAVFTVYLLGEKCFLEEAQENLRHPYYSIYLGKSNCIPCFPVDGDIIETADDEFPADGLILIKD